MPGSDARLVSGAVQDIFYSKQAITLNKSAMSIFSSKNFSLLKAPLNLQNPVTVQILGICSALAVTLKMKPAIVMGVSVIIVTAFSNLIISSIRNYIPPRIRIIVQLVVVATMVILVDQILRAFVYDVSKQLSVYVGLIITNCIIMGRLEAFAMANKPWPSFLDGLGNGAGYSMILIIVALIRELLGSGTIYGVHIIPKSFYDAGYANNGLMIMPTMALILVGVIIWIQRSFSKSLIEKD
jgi:Na+-transporting NADH:ubiquinone oxidoreductase subunit D